MELNVIVILCIHRSRKSEKEWEMKITASGNDKNASFQSATNLLDTVATRVRTEKWEIEILNAKWKKRTSQKRIEREEKEKNVMIWR